MEQKSIVTIGLIFLALYFIQPNLIPFAIVGDVQNNVNGFTIESFYEQACDVTFHSTLGDVTKTFNPCKFTMTAESEFVKMRANTASRGIIESRLQFSQLWNARTVSGNNLDCYTRGLYAADFSQDDLDWNIRWREEGQLNTEPLSESLGGKQFHTGNNYWSSGYNAYDKYCCEVGNSQPTYKVNDGVQIIDSSNTFMITASGGKDRYGGISCEQQPTFAKPYRIEFEIINPNFYETEKLERNTIRPPELREVDCPITNNMMLVQETYQAGEVLTLDALSYDVSHFCSSLPVVVLDTNGNRIRTEVSPYQEILDGRIHQVPSGELHEVFYIIETTSDIPVICEKVEVAKLQDGSCPEGSLVEDGKCMNIPVFDQDTGNCLAKAGILYKCSKGVWDATEKACVTQSENPCPTGYVLDNTKDIPECFYKPVQNVVCRDKDTAIYNPDLKGCYFTKTRQSQCSPDGEVTPYLDESDDRCKYQRPINLFCRIEGETLETLTINDVTSQFCQMIRDDELETCDSFAVDYIQYEKTSRCIRNPDEEFAPCLKNWDDSGAFCIQNPEYFYNVGCPAGYQEISKGRCVTQPEGIFYCDAGYNFFSKEDVPAYAGGFIGRYSCAKQSTNRQVCDADRGIIVTNNEGVPFCWKQAKQVYDDCPDGSFWDFEQGACIIQVSTETNLDCGGQVMVLDGKQVCLKNLDEIIDCDGKVVLIDGEEKCLKPIQTVLECEGEVVMRDGVNICLIQPDVVIEGEEHSIGGGLDLTVLMLLGGIVVVYAIQNRKK